jgi:hypothetical protein
MTLEYEPLLAQAEILSLIFREVVERTDREASEDATATSGELRRRRGGTSSLSSSEAPTASTSSAAGLLAESDQTIRTEAAAAVAAKANFPRISEALRDLI